MPHKHKKDPPGTRYVGGKKLVPFQGPKPKKRATVGRAGNYAQEVDPEGMDEAMKQTLGIGRRRNRKGAR